MRKVAAPGVREPPPSAPAPARAAPELPDDVLTHIFGQVGQLDDLFRAAGVSRQWRRVGRAAGLTAAHLARARAGAAQGLRQRDLHTEVGRQIQAARRLRGDAEVVTEALALPPDLTLLRLSRNADDGFFLVAQRPLGHVLFWPLDAVEAGAAPLTIAVHATPLSCLSVSATGMHVVSAASARPAARDAADQGSVRLWRRAGPPQAIVVAQELTERIVAAATTPDGNLVAACLSTPGGRETRLWQVGAHGEVFWRARLTDAARGLVDDAALARWMGRLEGRRAREGRAWAEDPLAAARVDADDDGADPLARQRRPELQVVVAPRSRRAQASGAMAVCGPMAVTATGARPREPRPDQVWHLGSRRDWRTATLSPCGTLLVAQAADDITYLWRLCLPPAADAVPRRRRVGAGEERPAKRPARQPEKARGQVTPARQRRRPRP